MENIKLTKREKEIVKKLQNGYTFICGQEFGAMLAKEYEKENIWLDVFFRLIGKGIIYQEGTHLEYVLTRLGESINCNQVAKILP